MTPTTANRVWQDLIATTRTLQKPTVLFGVSWDDYKELHRVLGNDYAGLRISFSKGILEIMPKSSEHEYYAELIKLFLAALALRRRQRILFFGSATLMKDEKRKGAEADASFFVSRANLISGKVHFDFAETPPDIVVEIDVHHASQEKFEIYSAFGVSEFWLYDEKELKIYRLNETGKYEEIAASVELPILTAKVLTEFLNRSQTADQTEILFEFDGWLEAQTQN